MNNKFAADLGCTLLTSMRLTQGNSVLSTLSLISTILGIILTIIRNVIIQINLKKKENKLKIEDLQEGIDKLIEAKDSTVDAVGEYIKKDKE